jgi:hypothetical protein
MYDDDVPSPIASSAYTFVDTTAYGVATYMKTMQALATLENLVGSSKFMAAMKVYTKEWAFKHPTGRDLFAVLERELGQDLGWYLGPVFHQAGTINLKVRSAKCTETHKQRGVVGEGSARKTVTETEAPDRGTYECDVVIQNTGVIHVPVDIEMRFADGSTLRKNWDDRGNGNWQRFEFERSSKLVEVRIDPDRKIALANPTQHAVRLAPDGSGDPSLRAAARIGTWAQLIMQIVGP